MATQRQESAIAAAVAFAPFVVFAAFPMPIPALPAISADLRAGTAELQLLVSGFALGLGALLIVGGVLADRFGPARVWIWANVVFAVFSGACALAPGPELLVAGRIGQGLAGAGLMASSLTLIATALPAPRRAGASAIWGAALGAGLSVGPLAGGLSLEFGHWRPAFWALLIACLAAAALGAVGLPRAAGSGAARVDVAGTVTLAGGIAALILAVNWAGAGDWGAPRVLIGLVVAAVLLAGFAVSQRRSARPMVDVAVLGNRTFMGGMVAGSTLAVTALSMMVVIGPYFQVVIGASALVLGLWFLPFTGLALVVALLGARIGTRFSLRARLVGGLVFCALGMAALLPVTAATPWPLLMPGMGLVGIGTGLANPALALAAVGAVPPERSGMAAGVANTARQLGNALGIVVLGAAMQAAALASALGAGASDPLLLRRIAGGDLVGAQAVSGDPAGVVDLYDTAQTDGVRAGLVLAIALAVVGTAVTAWLMRGRSPAAR
ncbi:MFS transporter [Actinomycetes bacterium KLBMP 9759]